MKVIMKKIYIFCCVVSVFIFTNILNGKDVNKSDCLILKFFNEQGGDFYFTNVIYERFIEKMIKDGRYNIVLEEKYEITQELVEIINEYESSGSVNKHLLNKFLSALPVKADKVIIGKTFGYRLSPYRGGWERFGAFLICADTRTMEITGEAIASFYKDRSDKIISSDINRVVRALTRQFKYQRPKKGYSFYLERGGVKNFADYDEKKCAEYLNKIVFGVNLLPLSEYVSLEGRMLALSGQPVFFHTPFVPVKADQRDDYITVGEDRMRDIYLPGAGVGVFWQGNSLWFKYLYWDVFDLSFKRNFKNSAVTLHFFHTSPIREKSFYTNDTCVSAVYEQAMNKGKTLLSVSAGYVAQGRLLFDSPTKMIFENETYTTKTFQFGNQYYYGVGITKRIRPYLDVAAGLKYVSITDAILDNDKPGIKNPVYFTTGLRISLLDINVGFNLNDTGGNFIGLGITWK